MRFLALTGLVLILGCGGRPPPVTEPGQDPPPKTGGPDEVPGQPGPQGELITADSPRTTPRGNAYTAPAGWSLIASGGIVILTSPDAASHVAIVDATKPDADAAVAEAWGLYRSTPAPRLAGAVDVPARDGWEAIRQYSYELPSNDRRAPSAIAMRHGTAWVIALFDLTQAAGEAHGAQFEQLERSILPKAP
jgi:hypothetical protein